MRKIVLLRLLAGTAATAVVLAGCGSRGGSGSAATSSSGASTASGTTTLAIGFGAPLTGDLSAVGLGLEHSAQVAVDDANSQHLVPGVTFTLVPKDDQATPSIGQQNAAAFVADASVVGVVGPYNSSVAEAMVQTFDTANLVEVSPANTNPALTQGPDYTTSETRQYKSYFRTIPTDSIESATVAAYAYNKLGIRKIALVNDGKVYGAGVNSIFAAEFKKLGGSVVVQQQISDSSTDYSAVVADIKNSGAQAVDYGGEYPQAGPLARQLKAAGVTIPLLGNDAVYDAQYIALAGATAANGSYVVTAGVPIGATAAQQKFISEYKTAGYTQPYGIFGPYSYDATMAIIEAVKAVAAANNGKLPASGLRAAVEAAVQSVSFTGLTGPVSFDQYGDTNNHVMVMNTVKNGQWTVIGPYNP